MAARKKSTAETLKDAIGAFGAKMQKEAEDFAALAVASFKRNYRRRSAKRKPAARTSVKRAASAVRKAGASTARKAVTASRKAQTAAKRTVKSRSPASRSAKTAPKTRRRR